jgi:hypothetical protein
MNVQYSFAVDTSGGSFSWSTLADQTYDSLGFSVSGAGTYDPTSTTYDWTASGLLGSDALSESGEMVWTGDPSATSSGTITLKNSNGQIVYQVTLNDTGTVTLSGGSRTSLMNGTLTISVPIQQTIAFEIDDNLNLGSNHWSAGPTLPYNLGGTWTNSGTTLLLGTTNIVPEPSGVALVGIGAIGLLARRKKVA